MYPKTPPLRGIGVPAQEQYTAEVVVVTSLTSPHEARCRRVLDLLEVKGARHAVIDLANDVDWDLDLGYNAQVEVLRVLSDQRALELRQQGGRDQQLPGGGELGAKERCSILPVVLIDGVRVGSDTDVQELEDAGRLTAMLMRDEPPCPPAGVRGAKLKACQEEAGAPPSEDDQSTALEDGSTDASSAGFTFLRRSRSNMVLDWADLDDSTTPSDMAEGAGGEEGAISLWCEPPEEKKACLSRWRRASSEPQLGRGTALLPPRRRRRATSALAGSLRLSWVGGAVFGPTLLTGKPANRKEAAGRHASEAECDRKRRRESLLADGDYGWTAAWSPRRGPRFSWTAKAGPGLFASLLRSLDRPPAASQETVSDSFLPKGGSLEPGEYQRLIEQ